MRTIAYCVLAFSALVSVPFAQSEGIPLDHHPAARMHRDTTHLTHTLSAPTAPTHLAATAGNAVVSLAWTGSIGATSYSVRRGTFSGGETKIASTTGTSYVDHSVLNGTTYYYVVRAQNSRGQQSSNSNEVSATPSAPLIAPLPPTGLVASPENQAAALSWNASAGATSYNVKQSSTSGGPYATIASTSQTSDTVNGLVNGLTYFFVVSAVNSVGESTNSGEVSVVPAVPSESTTILVGPTVTPTTTSPQAEEMIAVDPSNSSRLLAGVSDFSLRGGSNTSVYSLSTDNGAHWVSNYVPLSGGSPATGDGIVWPYNSDPVVAIDKGGYAYFANLYFHSENNNQSGGLYVSVMPPGATVFTQALTQPVKVNTDPATTSDEDKEWIAVDQSATATAGSVYVSWTHFEGNSDWISFSASPISSPGLAHGQGWTAPIQISPAGQNGAVQGSQVAVGPAGEIYVVYEVFFVGGLCQQWMAKSTNGGTSFSNPIAITPYFNDVTFSASYRKNSFSSLAVCPKTGNVYVVYADQPSTAQVVFIRSTDGGTTWSSPKVLNSVSSGHHFMPAVAVDGAGTIDVSWFDTRLTGTSSAYDIFATRSMDQGGSFPSNARVTSSSLSAMSFIGDYAGNASAGGSAHPVWTGTGFLQTATLQ